MEKRLVYLSGRMDGVSVEEGNTWRKKASEVLEEAGFDIYNPYDSKSSVKEDFKLYTANEIFHRDIFYLDKSDIVLVNLELPETVNAKDIPFFTIGEMFLAHRDRKPIISYTNCLKGRHGFEAIITKNLNNLEECLDYITVNFGVKKSYAYSGEK